MFRKFLNLVETVVFGQPVTVSVPPPPLCVFHVPEPVPASLIKPKRVYKRKAKKVETIPDVSIAYHKSLDSAYNFNCKQMVFVRYRARCMFMGKETYHPILFRPDVPKPLSTKSLWSNVVSDFSDWGRGDDLQWVAERPIA